jgi:alpha-L-fucosidase
MTDKDYMQWFLQARFGMFIHWGLYAIPARGEWVKQRESITTEDYQPFFDTFNPVDYDPRGLGRAARAAGMKYAVMTAKHHDGFCLFDTKYTDYKATNTQAGRDLIREYVDAFRAEGSRSAFTIPCSTGTTPTTPSPVIRIHPMRNHPDYQNHKGNLPAMPSTCTTRWKNC